MGRVQKILTTALWGLTVVAMLALVAGWWAKKQRDTALARPMTSTSHGLEGLPVLFPTPVFSLVDQNGTPFSSDSLAGNVWIADFIFTHCAGPCPKMTAMMSELQGRITRADVKLVSFSVDPERDTPAVLKEYADRFSADHARWKFLTGPREEIDHVARAMNISAEKSDDDNITHSTYFLLVDRAGKVRGVYRQSDSTDIDRLAVDVTALADDNGATEKSK